MAILVSSNPFYGPRLRAAGLADGVGDLQRFRDLCPPTTKDEVVADQLRHPPAGSNLSFPRARYVRLHQTSGTSGAPLVWLDTEASWRAMLGNWRQVLSASDVGASDVVLVAFSFGPFLGFWTAFEAAWEQGCLALSGGGMSSESRLELATRHGATVLMATPTYALRLAEVAASRSAARPPIAKVIVAGEPGGSVDSVRRRLSEAWLGAEVLDHHGMTEVGPVSVPNRAHPGVLHVLEPSYLAEIVDPDADDRPVEPGEIGELLLTTLDRPGMPLLRYRTGDLVRRSSRSAEELGSSNLALDGGILARRDDMVVVRGVNLYPSAVDRVLRTFPEVAEYRVELSTRRAMTEARLDVEPEAGAGVDLGRRLEAALRDAFQLRLPVRLVDPGALPRFELKGRRWIRRTEEAG